MVLGESTSMGGGASGHKPGKGGRREGPAVTSYPGSGGSRSAGGRGRIGELERIEFTGAEAISEYARVMRALARDLTAELVQAADEVEAVLSRQHGHPLLFGLDCRFRARRVAARLLRGAEAAGGIAVEAVKFNVEFRTAFADVLQPRRQRRPDFDWQG